MRFLERLWLGPLRSLNEWYVRGGIIFQTGQARWADTGTVLFGPVRKRPGPTATVPVPSTARPRARAWAAMPARWHDMGTARFSGRHGGGTASSCWMEPPPRLLTVGSRGRVGWLYKPAAAAPLLALRLLAFQTLSHSSFRPLSPFQRSSRIELSASPID